MNSQNKIRVRQISHSDIPAIVDLLSRGFPDQARGFWQNALAQLTAHHAPEGFPQYGYLLESNGGVVGAILQIFSTRRYGNTIAIQCNLSSWFVDPAFRGYGSFLASKALSDKNVIYLNISPAAATLPILKVQGYSRYSSGIFLAVPGLHMRSSGTRVSQANPGFYPLAPFEAFDHDLLTDHAGYGCLSLWCETAQRAYPFAFRKRLHKGKLRYAQLIYCSNLGDFVRFAGPVGRFLIKRGLPLVMIDANGPIPGLIGRYRDGKQQKYFRGPDRPRLGDLAYTEAAMFDQ